jgi:hypothetical protein
MLSLMLDPRFKILHQISSFIVYEVGVTIVEDYDIKFISYVFKILSSFATSWLCKSNNF